MNREVKTVSLKEMNGFFLALFVCYLDSKRREVRKKFKVRFWTSFKWVTWGILKNMWHEYVIKYESRSQNNFPEGNRWFFLALCLCYLISKEGGVRKKYKVRFWTSFKWVTWDILQNMWHEYLKKYESRGHNNFPEGGRWFFLGFVCV